MLRRTPSLALRASLIFMAVYAAILLSVVGVSAAATWLDRGEGNLRGATVAVDYAREELRQVAGSLQLPGNGRFADLAARNPSLWLIAMKDGRMWTIGAVPAPARGMTAQLQGAVDAVVFRLPHQAMPLQSGTFRQVELEFGSVSLAAGGVEAATLSTRESFHLLFEPEIAAMLVFIAVISLLAMLVAVPFFARALVPITAEAATIGPHDPGRRLHEINAPRELLPLVRGFNAALDRLELELGRRKRFIADAAHELRTPLAVVTLQAESLPDGAGKADLQRGVARLIHLVAQMLDLERLSLSAQSRDQIDLVAVTRDVVADLAPLAIGKGYDLSLDAPPISVMVSGDANAITRAVTNLVSNAIIHGGGTGSVRVRVSSDTTIEVSDEGPGVPVDLQPRLFEPFARGDSSVDGCGLGLHLTRGIMTAHGGEVRFHADAGGTTFSLVFPPQIRITSG